MCLLIVGSFPNNYHEIASYLIDRKVERFYFTDLDRIESWTGKLPISKILLLNEEGLKLPNIRKIESSKIDWAILNLKDNNQSYSNLNIVFDSNSSSNDLNKWLKNQDESKVDRLDFMIKVGDVHKRINVNDICFIKSDGKYISLHFKNRKLSVRSNLTQFHKSLSSNFIRVHASYIVNLSFVESIKLNSQKIILDEQEVPFSRQYKNDLLSNFDFV